jgi:hypothetical protein
MDNLSPSYDLIGLSTKSTGGKISKVRFDNTKQEFESNEVLFATGSWDTPKVSYFLVYRYIIIISYFYLRISRVV